jgi:sugar/nucleoside kinase (ribokinase family)
VVVAGKLRPVVAAGHICLDVLPDLSAFGGGRLERALRPGRLLEVGAATLSSGGSAANTGLALQRLGVPVRLAAKIGADPLGRLLQELIEAQAAGLSAGLTIDPEAATAYSIVLSPPGQDRAFLHCPGANATFGAADVPEALLVGAGWLHCGYPPVMARLRADGGAELIALLRRARAAGLGTSLDLCALDAAAAALDWRAWLRGVLPWVDVFLPSFDELWAAQFPGEVCPALETVGLAQLRQISAELLGWGAGTVVIKLGARGLYGRDAASEVWAAARQVQVIGTTGAGDAAIAGYLAARGRGAGLAVSLATAAAVGAANCEAADALSGIPSWEALAARLAAGWPTEALDLAEAGWFWESAAGVWLAHS